DFVARTDVFQGFVKEIAMQVAATNPLAVDRENLSPESIEKEKEIYREQALGQGKPEKIIDRIVEGKLAKYFQEVCLLEQPYIKDTDKSVKDLLTEAAAKLGENITVRRFVRFRLGE
ncbi:MAG: translation elongation factor Ts, partial [bacterium]